MGKLILITGVTRGLGRALTEWYIANGHTVVGCGRSAEVLELRFTHPEPNDFTALDVAAENKVALWAERVLAKQGVPDVLVNNAALINDPAPLWKVPARDFDKLIDVNIKGVANVLRHFLPAMVKRGTGTIVNLSSGWGRNAGAEVGPYCASKFAVEGMTKSLAQEIPAGMCAVPMNPGVIDTPMLRQAWGEGAAQHVKPDEWAKAAGPFILSLGPKDNGKSVSVSAYEG